MIPLIQIQNPSFKQTRTLLRTNTSGKNTVLQQGHLKKKPPQNSTSTKLPTVDNQNSSESSWCGKKTLYIKEILQFAKQNYFYLQPPHTHTHTRLHKHKNLITE